MIKTFLRGIGAVLASLALTTSVAACSSSVEEEEGAVKGLEVEQSQGGAVSQSGAIGTSGGYDFLLTGPFEVIDPADPDNIELPNACLQLRYNMAEIEPYLGSINEEIDAVDPSSDEAMVLQNEYLEVLEKTIANIGNEEILGLWDSYISQLIAIMEDPDVAANSEEAEATLEELTYTASELLEVCSPYLE